MDFCGNPNAPNLIPAKKISGKIKAEWEKERNSKRQL